MGLWNSSSKVHEFSSSVFGVVVVVDVVVARFMLTECISISFKSSIKQFIIRANCLIDSVVFLLWQSISVCVCEVFVLCQMMFDGFSRLSFPVFGRLALTHPRLSALDPRSSGQYLSVGMRPDPITPNDVNNSRQANVKINRVTVVIS